MPDFNKGKIYKITNDSNDDIYIGSTTNSLTKRFSVHHVVSKYEQYCNRPLYKLINEIGFNRFRIQLIENYPCEDKFQLRQREGFYIRQFGTLNIFLAGRSGQESNKNWRDNNKEIISQNSKEYYIQKKDIIDERNKMYYNNHADEIKESKKNYRLNLSEEKKKEQHDRKREKITCSCGCMTARSDISKHMKTKKHIDLMNNKLLEI